MENLLYYPILDLNRPKANELKQQIESWLYDNLITDDEHKANAYLVGGGDGFMLDTVKKNYNFDKSPEENKLFFWINCGTLGFLLNDISLDTLPLHINDIDVIKAHMMQVDMVTKDGKYERRYALNDIVVWGNILDYYKFQIDAEHLHRKFHGTGIMMSTALWSTAYRMNNWGPLMPASSLLRGISGISSLPFDHKIITPETLQISISWRTPAMVGVDGYGGKVENVDHIIVSPTDHYTKVAFIKDTPFDTKRILLAEQKLLRDDF